MKTELTDHAREKLEYWLRLHGILELYPIDTTTESVEDYIQELCSHVDEYPEVMEYSQCDMTSGDIEKGLYVVDLRAVFYDTEREDYWAYLVAVVDLRGRVMTVMPEGFAKTSVVTGRFRKAA